MILNPSSFPDVILNNNMFGDILSDQGSVIAGSIGLLHLLSVGLELNARCFDLIHGSYPECKGKKIIGESC